MKIALAQTDIVWEYKEKNKESYSKLLLKAKQSGADLILFPEMSLTGFSMNLPSIAESVDEPSGTVQWFKNQAVVHNIYIGFGYTEKVPEDIKAKNIYCVATPEGAILSKYCKIHPFSYGLEAQYYTGGDKIEYLRIKDFIVSTFVCYDLRFPEIFQIASRTASLITVAANWPKSRREHWITLLKARAIENQCYIAGINRIGTGDNLVYSGDSMLIDPLGNVLVRGADTEELLIHDIGIDDVQKVRDNFRLKADRREDLYCSFYKE